LHTAFPFTLLVSEAVTEATLLECFKQLGGQVLRPHTAVGIEQDDSTVVVTFANGPPMRAKIVVGADGAHSTVRKQLGIKSKRNNMGASYTLADVHPSGGVPNDELVIYFSLAGYMVVLIIRCLRFGAPHDSPATRSTRRRAPGSSLRVSSAPTPELPDMFIAASTRVIAARSQTTP
jgi:2-polyprenyl-6-methoxyphenol hydroxylase-like FAD-dependent oxidoreductase